MGETNYGYTLKKKRKEAHEALRQRMLELDLPLEFLDYKERMRIVKLAAIRAHNFAEPMSDIMKAVIEIRANKLWVLI